MEYGERQVATELKDIRRDHVARYEWVAKSLQPGSYVIDLACGIGYGANIMAQAGHKVVACDIDTEALEYGATHWSHERVEFCKTDGSLLNGTIGDFGAAVCFETIEHIQDPEPLLRSLRLSAQILIASVPNEDVMPFEFPDGNTVSFHYRHYTKKQFEQLLKKCGWKVAHWMGQEGPESEVVGDMLGRTLIAVCEHAKPAPEHIVILGLGPSVDEYTNLAKRLGDRKNFADEVWSINMLGNIFDSDLVFHMDDVKIQEIRSVARPESNIAAMTAWLRGCKTPVMTSRAYPDYPSLVEFPLEDVLNDLGYDYFNSTAAYAVAYAIHIGVKKISLFGCDYTYPNAHDAEKGRACVEFWLGMAAERGIKISVPKKSSLMDAMYSRDDRFYGYDTRKVNLETVDGRVVVSFTDVETLPTADEIEAKYDHSAHPNGIVEAASCE